METQKKHMIKSENTIEKKTREKYKKTREQIQKTNKNIRQT